MIDERSEDRSHSIDNAFLLVTKRQALMRGVLQRA